MTDITTQSTLPQISLEDRAALRDAKNSLVGDELTRPLPPDVRDRLSKFLAATERFDIPSALDSQIDHEVSLLMVSFKSARAISAIEASVTVAAYIDILRGLPLWAIRDGLRKVRLGEVEGVSLDFPPAAPRLRKVVTDEMIPIRSDRSDVRRILAAKDAVPENPVMVKRTEPLIRGALNPMQQKFGPNYGLGGVLQTNELGFAPAPARPTERQTMPPDRLIEHYRTHGLQFKPKPDRNDDRNGDETFHGDEGREVAAR
jgi:hypothetical protein